MDAWEIFKQSGPVAAVLGAGLIVLWRKLEAREKQISDLQEEIQALLTQRAQENAERFTQLVEALKANDKRRTEPPRTDYSITTRTRPIRE